MVIGEINQTEYQSFDKAVSTGLGIGLKTRDYNSELTTSNVSKKLGVSASVGCPEDLPKVEKELRIVLTSCPPIQAHLQQVPVITDKSNSKAHQPSPLSSSCKKEVRITLDRLSINRNQKLLVSHNTVVESRKVVPSTEKGKDEDSEDTMAYSSDDTEAYWPLDPKKQIVLFPKINVQQSCTTPAPKQRLIMAKPSFVHKFNISIHGIHHRRPHYYFKCVVAGCIRTFDKIRDWNFHHHLSYKTQIKCAVCGKNFVTPSSRRAHKNIHAAHKFNCKICHKFYAYGLHQHKIIHNKSKKYRCFHGTCRKAYKWPQDLTRHIQHHMNPQWACDQCDFVLKKSDHLKNINICHATTVLGRPR